MSRHKRTITIIVTGGTRGAHGQREGELIGQCFWKLINRLFIKHSNRQFHDVKESLVRLNLYGILCWVPMATSCIVRDPLWRLFAGYISFSCVLQQPYLSTSERHGSLGRPVISIHIHTSLSTTVLQSQPYRYIEICRVLSVTGIDYSIRQIGNVLSVILFEVITQSGS